MSFKDLLSDRMETSTPQTVNHGRRISPKELGALF